MNQEILEVLEICNALDDQAEWHFDERGLAAMQASAFLWGVDLWVEVFHADSVSSVRTRVAGASKV